MITIQHKYNEIFAKLKPKKIHFFFFCIQNLCHVLTNTPTNDGMLRISHFKTLERLRKNPNYVRMRIKKMIVLRPQR